MLQVTALALIAAPAFATPRPAQAEAPTAETFADDYEEIERLMQRRRWRDAYGAFQTLFEAHAEAPYVIARLPQIEPDLKRVVFWRDHDEPDLDDLMEADVKRWDPYRGSVKLELDRERLGDFNAHSSALGTVYELPAVWDDTWTATFEGPASTLQGNQFYVLINPDESYVFTVGCRPEKAFLYYKHIASQRKGKRTTVLEQADPVKTAEDEEITARLIVSSSRVRLEVDRKRVFDVKRDDDGGLGRFAFAFKEPGDFGTLELEGRAETGWFDGVIDAAVQEARSAFDATWNPAEHMPDWLAGADRHFADEALPELGMFPVPEAFDLVARVHPRNEEHIAKVEAYLRAAKYGAALDYLRDLDAEEIDGTVQAFLSCVTLYLADRPREAFEVGRKLWEEQPDSLTAGYLEATLHALLKRIDLADERFRALTESHPEAWESWYGLTSLLLLQRRVDDAVVALERGRAAASNQAYLQRLEGRIALLTRGPAWDRVFEEETLHFRIRSDTDARTTRAVAREVQKAWQNYERWLGTLRLPRDETVPLFLFSGEATYRAYAASALASDMQHTAGLFSRPLQVVLIWNAPSEDTLNATIRHEVLHQYLDARLGDLPPWFNEGLAEYYELVETDRGDTVLGAPHPGHMRVLDKLRKLPDVRTVTFLSPAEFYASADISYPLAWAFVHFLQHSGSARKARFDDLWARLEAGEDGRSAVQAAFDGVDWEAWQRDFRAHVKGLARAPR